jgi:hypothetical protein
MYVCSFTIGRSRYLCIPAGTAVAVGSGVQ